MILMTGGSGLLGKELKQYVRCVAPTHKELDITKPETFPNERYSSIIHCAAYTDVVKAEKDMEKCHKINVEGTKNLLNKYPQAKFIYISSEYARNPLNNYSMSKAMAELEVEKYAKRFLIIRTSFIKRPFPHKYAFFDQYTQGDYVDVIAPLISQVLKSQRTGLIYIGTGRKTMFDLARQTKPNIKGISVRDIKSVTLPYDYQ